MSAEVNYKNKYMEIRAKYMADLDMAFRLGFEQGQQQAQQEQVMQQQAQQQEADMGGDMDEQDQPKPGEDQPGEQSVDSQNPNGSELDQHISKLESMLGKSELDPIELRKTINELKQGVELKKSAQAISGIAKALHKPKFKMGVQASHNLTDSAKKAVTMQHNIVTDIMKSWAEEEKKASGSIKSILGVEGLTKKE